MMKKLLLTGAFIACGGLFLLPGQQTAPHSVTMPATQQNAMVQTYCAVCHTDASMNGGLSLEHFDAAHADPGEAAMMVSKLKGQALGASGAPLPDRATQDAFERALSVEAAGADRWTVHRGPVLTASVVRQAPSSKNGGDPDAYHLRLTCHPDTHQTEIQLAWSPGVPAQGRSMSVAVDGSSPSTYKIEGIEKNGNGMAGMSGPGSVILHSPFPEKTLTVSNLFGSETVVFPFDDLDPAVATCFIQSKSPR